MGYKNSHSNLDFNDYNTWKTGSSLLYKLRELLLVFYFQPWEMCYKKFKEGAGLIRYAELTIAKQSPPRPKNYLLRESACSSAIKYCRCLRWLIL